MLHSPPPRARQLGKCHGARGSGAVCHSWLPPSPGNVPGSSSGIQPGRSLKSAEGGAWHHPGALQTKVFRSPGLRSILRTVAGPGAGAGSAVAALEPGERAGSMRLRSAAARTSLHNGGTAGRIAGIQAVGCRQPSPHRPAGPLSRTHNRSMAHLPDPKLSCSLLHSMQRRLSGR